MAKLLDLVRVRLDTENIDITLKFTLSALWNLTDESSTTCEVIIRTWWLISVPFNFCFFTSPVTKELINSFFLSFLTLI